MPERVTFDPYNVVRPAAWALWLAVASFAFAQPAADDGGPQLPAELRSATTINDQQSQQIAGYVAYWTKQLGEGDREAVVDAQDELGKRFEGTLSPQFRQAYSQALGPALATLAKHESDQVRMAAMLLAANLSGGTGAEALAAGLADKHLGVRYFAASALAQAMSSVGAGAPPPYNEQQQRAFLSSLKQAMPAENSPRVFQKMGAALSALALPETFKESLEILRQRLGYHRLNPEVPPRTAVEMVDNLITKLAIAGAANQNTDADLKELTAVSGLYLKALAEMLPNAPQDAIARQGWEELVERIERPNGVFDKALKRFAPNASGPSIGALIRKKDGWGESLQKAIIAWVGDGNQPGVLTKDLGIAADRLQLPPLPEASAKRVPQPAGAKQP